LTVVSGIDQSAPLTKTVVASAVHSKPTVSTSIAPFMTGWQVSLTDNSLATTPSGTIGSVKVAWGDGIVSTGNAGDTFTHNYSPLRARSYTIVHTAVDAGSRLSKSESFSIFAPERYTVSGVVTTSTGSALNGTTVSLKKNGHTVKYQRTTGNSFTFSNVLPGDYTIKAFIYTHPTTTINDTPLSVVSSNATVTISATNP
jgi:hypothetical protein